MSIKPVDKKSFASDQEVRWCPGCGDYAILAAMQKVLSQQDIDKASCVFISGIGCSSRFPYYLDCYGFHTIHGRAPAIATGVKLAKPDSHVFVVTGDGDGFSIGTNHTLQLIRRNLNITILLFNNEIYGLTKGQYSPTSRQGQVTKSTPFGSVDAPLSPMALALAANCSFMGRAIDIDSPGLQATLQAAMAHEGTSLVEIFQNCNVFNDGAFSHFADRTVRAERTISLAHGKPMIYGQAEDKGLRYVNGRFELTSSEQASIFDATDINQINALVHPEALDESFPVPIGVLRQSQRPLFEAGIAEMRAAQQSRKKSLAAYLEGPSAWTVGAE